MVDTVRSIVALQALLADNITGNISPQDMRDVLVSMAAMETTTGQYSDSTSQKPVDLLLNAILFNTDDEASDNLTHLSPGEFTIIDNCHANFIFAPQWERTGGGSTEFVNFWMQRDVGAGFVDVANSTVQAVAVGNGESGVVPMIWGGHANAGDVFRLVQSVSTTGNGLGIVATAAAAPVPAIPSIILTVNCSLTLAGPL